MTIIHGDCLEVMRTIPDGSFRVIVTSPPYNLLSPEYVRDYRDFKALKHGYDEWPDDLPHEQYVAWQRSCLAEMLRLLREDGAIFYNHKWRSVKGLNQDRNDIVGGFPVRQLVIWDRGGTHNMNPHYFPPTYEIIYLIAKPKFKLTKHAYKYGSVWRVPPDATNPHPAPFPVEIPYRCIISSGGGPVLDPFAGSGSTGVAAIQLGAEFTLIELSKKYAEMATARVTKAVPQQRLV